MLHQISLWLISQPGYKQSTKTKGTRKTNGERRNTCSWKKRKRRRGTKLDADSGLSHSLIYVMESGGQSAADVHQNGQQKLVHCMYAMYQNCLEFDVEHVNCVWKKAVDCLKLTYDTALQSRETWKRLFLDSTWLQAWLFYDNYSNAEWI